jgi:hypothetical protein
MLIFVSISTIYCPVVRQIINGELGRIYDEAVVA